VAAFKALARALVVMLVLSGILCETLRMRAKSEMFPILVRKGLSVVKIYEKKKTHT
jgi:hypothetical protein